MQYVSIKLSIGEVTLYEDGGKIIALDWGQGMDAPRTTKNPVLLKTIAALGAYFKSGQDDFASLPLDPHGTTFQRRVWQQMQNIPAGQTRTYGEVAKTLKSSARAVGTACGANPIPILIPCHRIVGQRSLGGYSGDGGIDTKMDLLRLEGRL